MNPMMENHTSNDLTDKLLRLLKLIFKLVFYYAQTSNMPTIKCPEVHEVQHSLRVFSSMNSRFTHPEKYISPFINISD